MKKILVLLASAAMLLMGCEKLPDYPILGDGPYYGSIGGYGNIIVTPGDNGLCTIRAGQGMEELGLFSVVGDEVRITGGAYTSPYTESQGVRYIRFSEKDLGPGKVISTEEFTITYDIDFREQHTITLKRI